VLDSNGKIISDFPPYINGRAQSFFNWQNAEQLRMIQQDEDSKVTIQLLNPFNQEHSILRTNWSGVYAPENPFYDKLVQWKFDQKITDISYVYGANILFDPTLTRVLYPKDGSIVSLTDVENEAELVQGNFTDWGRLPQWSLDGENLAIVNREGNVDEFYLVNRNGGEFERITDFASEFDYATIPDYTWSPDGSQIAFWLELDQTNVEDGPQSELAILDIPTRQVTRLCIEGISNNAYEPWVMNHPEIHWSPDGNYIMITTWDDPDNRRNYSVLVVDPLTGAVEEISQNTAPIGWMVKEE
jgi:Tol biopolymer transport system component